jgi:EXLDI family protein
MPNKMIYVSEADLPTFERAQELAGGNLSGVIARALRLFVQTEEAKLHKLEDVTVEVKNEAGVAVRQQFRARLLAKQRQHTPDDRLVSRVVYYTAKGKFAVYTKEIAHWSRYSEEDWQSWDWSNRDYCLDVYETLDDLQPHLPAPLYEAAARAFRGEEPAIEVLDI